MKLSVRALAGSILAPSVLVLGFMSAGAGMAQPTGRGALFYIGTQSSGPGKGLFAARLDERTGHLTALGVVANLEKPSWLLASPFQPVLYAVGAGKDGKSEGSISSLLVDSRTGSLELIDAVGSGGGDPTNLALDVRHKALLAANYGTGQVASLPLRPDGGLLPAASVQDEHGSGPHRRQAAPHTHGVAVSPDGGFVLTADFGGDRLFIYRLDPVTKALSPAANPSVALQPGSGPRHLLFHPRGTWLFVNTELSAGLRSYRWTPRTAGLDLVQTVTVDSTEDPAKRSAAEIVISRDGHTLYASSRGDNTVVVYAVNDHTGFLTEVQRVPCQGKTPWSMSLDPSGRWMIVANQGSDELAVFKVDHQSGRLAATDQRLSVPTPSNITFVPR